MKKLRIGSYTPDFEPNDQSTASLQLDDTNVGLLVNRLTTVQRDAIVSPAEGLLIYNTTSHLFQVFASSVWQSVAYVSTEFVNPMTTAEDLIVGNTGGTGHRLAVGSNTQVLTVTAGTVGWAAANPMTVDGDIIIRSGGVTARLAIGSANNVLTSFSGLPAWRPVYQDPMTTIGDIVYRDGTNTTARLGIGSETAVLTVSSGQPAWLIPFISPMTTAGDMIIRNGSNSTVRLALGSSGFVLKSNGTIPTWASLYPLLADNGLENAPSYTFASDTGTGFYRSGTNVVGYSSNGTQAMTFSNSVLKFANSNFSIIGADPSTTSSTSPTLTITTTGGGSSSGNAGALSLLTANATTEGLGGAISITAGNATSAGATAHVGGSISVTAGNSVNASNGGTITVTGGTGGSTGNGGAVRIFGGTTGSGGSHPGGTATLQGGAAASSSANTGGVATVQGGTGDGAGSGGAVTLVGGTPGITGVGGAITITGGAGGATSGNAAGVTIAGGTPIGGNGGAIAIIGSAGVGSNKNGGNVTITAGVKTGGGTPGYVDMSATTSAMITPVGSTALQPTGTAGMIRYDSDTGKFRAFQSGTWLDMIATGTPTYPLQGPDGLVGTTTYGFSSDTGMGLYFISSGHLGIAIGGVLVENISNTTTTFTASQNRTLIPGAAATTSSTGGTFTIQGGPGGSSSGTGGVVALLGGTPAAGDGGAVTITGAAGVGTNKNGGGVTITSGAATGNGAAGSISLVTPTIGNILLGAYGTSRLPGSFAFSNTSFATSGDAQYGLYVLRQRTTNGTPKAATSDAAAVSATNQLVLVNNSSIFFRASVIARRTDAATDNGAFTVTGTIYRNSNAASTTLLSQNRVVESVQNSTAWTVTAAADTTNGALTINVTGEAAKTISWTVVLNTTEVSG